MASEFARGGGGLNLQPSFPGDVLMTVRLLLKAGLDPNLGSQFNGRRPLGSAAVHGLTTVVEELLAHGANQNLREAYTFKSDGDQHAAWAAVIRRSSSPMMAIPFRPWCDRNFPAPA